MERTKLQQLVKKHKTYSLVYFSCFRRSQSLNSKYSCNTAILDTGLIDLNGKTRKT